MYKIADFIIDYKNIYNTCSDWLSEYIVPDGKADFTFLITSADIEAEESPDIKASKQELQFVAMHRKLGDVLSLNGAFVFHSVAIDVGGVGVAFAAHSGTGKSTHMMRWQSFLGDKMTVVNGDKPIVRFFEDEPETPYIYGTPWMGKENLGCNMRTQLKHICFIERSDTNFTEKAPKEQVIDRILNQVYMPKDPTAAMNTIGLIDRLLSNCELWIIHCNMDMDAGEKAYKTIFNK